MLRHEPISKPPLGNFLSKKPLSNNEARLFSALLNASSNDFYVFPKMAMYEIISCTNPSDFGRFARKSVDFMIYDTHNMSPICAIELDDYSHHSKKAKHRDSVKDYFLNRAGIPVVRLPVYPTFIPEKIRELIETAVAIPDIPYPVPAPANVEVEHVHVSTDIDIT